MKVDLKLSYRDFEKFHTMVHPEGGRSPKLITVPRQLLVDMLIDYGRMHKACINLGVELP